MATVSQTSEIPSQRPAALEEVETPRYPRRIQLLTMAGILLVLLLAMLDQTIVGTALPRIIANLNGFSEYAWVATAYLLTSTITVPIYGKLSDLFGRKWILLFAVVVFLIGSALSGASQTMTQLILFRGFQGLGAGGLMSIAIAVVGDILRRASAPNGRASPARFPRWPLFLVRRWAAFLPIISPGAGFSM